MTRERRPGAYKAELLRPVQRWTYRRKVEICRAIEHGTITFADVERKLGVPAAEVGEWYAAFKRAGADALRVAWPKRRSDAA